MTNHLTRYLPLVLCLLACEQAHRNPCGAGLRPSAAEDRCVEATDADMGPVSGSDDAGIPRRDAGPEKPTPIRDAGGQPALDADDAPPPEAGDGVEAGTAPPVVDPPIIDPPIPTASCAEPDVQAWEAFLLSDRLVSQIGSCSKALGCTPGSSCALDGCLRTAVGIMTCESCVASEVTCVANNCQAACATSDQECRACACAAGCIGQFESCAGRSLSVCTACDPNAGQCGPSPLAVELIMVIVNPLLL